MNHSTGSSADDDRLLSGTEHLLPSRRVRLVAGLIGLWTGITTWLLGAGLIRALVLLAYALMGRKLGEEPPYFGVAASALLLFPAYIAGRLARRGYLRDRPAQTNRTATPVAAFLVVIVSIACPIVFAALAWLLSGSLIIAFVVAVLGPTALGIVGMIVYIIAEYRRAP